MDNKDPKYFELNLLFINGTFTLVVVSYMCNQKQASS